MYKVKYFFYETKMEEQVIQRTVHLRASVDEAAKDQAKSKRCSKSVYIEEAVIMRLQSEGVLTDGKQSQ